MGHRCLHYLCPSREDPEYKIRKKNRKGRAEQWGVMKYGKFSLGYTKFEIPVFSGRRGCFWNSREILGYTNVAAQCCRGNSGNHRWGWKDSGTVLNLKSARTELCRTSGVRCQREALVGDWKRETKWRKPGETAVPQGRGENVSKPGVINNYYILRRD